MRFVGRGERVGPGVGALVKTTLSALTIALLASVPAAAQGFDWGLRGGIEMDPDGFAFGAHARFQAKDFPQLAIVPSAALSVGDVGSVDYTAVRLAANGHWYFDALQDFTPFAIGGLSVYIFDPDVGVAGFGGDSSTNLGFNLGGGVDFGAISTELWLGVGDIPDVALWFAYTFP